MSFARSTFTLVALSLAACSPSPAPADALDRDALAQDALAQDAVTNDAPAPQDGSTLDAPNSTDASSSVGRCPSGLDPCFTLTPAATGLPSSGANADAEQYALRPASNPRGNLLVFLNGSGGSPRTAAATPTNNFYTVARDAGLHVLAVSYRSDDAVGQLCATAAMRDACFLATRTTILTGRFQPGSATALSGIAEHEGVYARVLAALVTLHREDPAGGWGAFFDAARIATPEQAIRWPLVLASGHSQGGGHAALLGRRHALERVIALASPCDNVAGTPASWLVNDGMYATDPATRFVGIAATGDRICSAFAAVWESLRMAPAARVADAVVCAGFDEHAAPLKCLENAGRWRAALAAR
ncbi:MAG: hypothetical protein U0269_08540 [Polyangiales bacterium]